MRDRIARTLCTLTFQLLTTVPVLFLVTRWQYGHLTRVDADRGGIPWIEFAAAGAIIWFITGMTAGAVLAAVVRPFQRWVGLLPAAAAGDELEDDDPDDDPEPPRHARPQLRSV